MGKRNVELWNKVKELYPTMSAKEISKLTGVCSTTIWCIAKSQGLSHNEETQKRLNMLMLQNLKSGDKRTYTPEEKAKRSKSQKKTMVIGKNKGDIRLKAKDKAYYRSRSS